LGSFVKSKLERPKGRTHFWLEIAMDDSMMPHKDKGSEELSGESSDEGRREAGKGVCLDELVKVD
jgi:hypothetical protein